MEISEALGSRPAGALLGDAVATLDLSQEVKFQAYSRYVLPIDGYVFWVPTVVLCVQGSLHHLQEIQQREDETLGTATTFFTTQTRITEFSESPIDTIFVARQGGFRYAFTVQQGFYEAERFWHYQGGIIPPALATQLLDDPTRIDPSRAVVSNSLPMWLSLNSYISPYFGGFSSNVTLYPSFAVPPNLTPPYVAVHIAPEWTRAVQSVPLIQRIEGPLYSASGAQVVDSAGNPVLVPWRQHSQLMADRVRVTLYGLQNDEALDFLDAVLEYSANVGGFGIMNTPAVMDGKRTQPELQALAMQKVIEFEVSYNQARAKSVAIQTIQSVQATILQGSGSP